MPFHLTPSTGVLFDRFRADVLAVHLECPGRWFIRTNGLRGEFGLSVLAPVVEVCPSADGAASTGTALALKIYRSNSRICFIHMLSVFIYLFIFNNFFRNPVGGPCLGDPRQYKICNTKVE